MKRDRNLNHIEKGGRVYIVKCQHFDLKEQWLGLDLAYIRKWSVPYREEEEERSTWKIQSDTNFLNKYSRVTDKL
jgi:hypothetical protein